jgi:hypothetical protein
MLTYLEARAIAGIEEVVGDVYRRTVCEGAAFGIVAVGHDPARHSLIVTVTFPSVRALPAILTRVRRVFDVGADIETIGRICRAIRCLRRSSRRGPACVRRADGTGSSWRCVPYSASR